MKTSHVWYPVVLLIIIPFFPILLSIYLIWICFREIRLLNADFMKLKFYYFFSVKDEQKLEKYKNEVNELLQLFDDKATLKKSKAESVYEISISIGDLKLLDKVFDITSNKHDFSFIRVPATSFISLKSKSYYYFTSVKFGMLLLIGLLFLLFYFVSSKCNDGINQNADSAEKTSVVIYNDYSNNR